MPADNGKYGLIDKTGIEVIQCKYDNAKFFVRGFASVKLNDESFSINKNGDNIDSIIRESSLLSCIKDIDTYRSKLNPKQPSNSVSFQINRPYLAISTGEDTQIDIEKDISILQYSENLLDDESINNVKTIIISYPYLYDSKSYGIYRFSKEVILWKKNYGEVIIYYDVNNKKFIGHDIIKGPVLPDTTTDDKSLGVYPLDKIESHLVN